MISTLSFLRSVAGGVIASPLAAEAQQPAKVYQVGFVSLGSQPTKGGLWLSFIEGRRRPRSGVVGDGRLAS